MADTIDESQLIEQAKTDPDAFGQLYKRYFEKIYTYIYYRVGNHHDTEDLTAKVFFRALNHIPHYKNRGVPFAAWLYRIAHNVVANWYRDHSRRQLVALDSVPLSEEQRGNPDQAAEQVNKQEILLAAIQHLPPERQKLLTLKFIEKMTNAEIGQIMGRSEGAIKSLYHRTLIALKKLLAEHENLVLAADTDGSDPEAEKKGN